MIPRGSEDRQGTSITLVSVHTAEGATTTANLAGYLDQPGVEASYHVLVDDNGAYRYLPDDVAAWAMLSGNHRSVQVCLTAFAAWSRGEWLAHDTMLRSSAAQVRAWCAEHGIPPVKLTPAQVGGDHSGVCGHWDWTVGKRDGTHTDPGQNFPWDTFMSYVTIGGDELTPDESSKLTAIFHALTDPMTSEVPGSTHSGSPRDFWRNTDRAAYMGEQVIKAQQATITALTGAVAAQHQLSTSDIKALLDAELSKVVNVAVTVDTPPSPPVPAP